MDGYKEKTRYRIRLSLVGSETCIRDNDTTSETQRGKKETRDKKREQGGQTPRAIPAEPVTAADPPAGSGRNHPGHHNRVAKSLVATAEPSAVLL